MRYGRSKAPFLVLRFSFLVGVHRPFKNQKPETVVFLPFSEVIADPDRSARNCVAAELVRQAGHVMKIELGTNEYMLGKENLHARAKVDIEMIRGSHRFRLALYIPRYRYSRSG